MKTTFAITGGLSGALALPNNFAERDYACNPAHSYPNGAACASTNGALSLVTPTPAAATSYACNPAHSYPNGAACVSTNGALSLVTPAPAATSSTAYACNPAHSYPNGAACVSTNEVLSLVTPTPAASSSTSYACNPAHSYPNGAVCIAVSGALTLATPAATPSPAGQAAPQLGTWTVENLSRYCGEDGSGCDYNFDIKTSDGFSTKCTVIQSNGVGPKSNWANAPCTSGSLHHVSWGYAETSNPPFAVMTIDQIQDKTRAFFGVPDVNGQFHGQQDSTYGSGSWEKLGPEPVNAVN
ncbi:hypothetical protein AAFC00_003369 [Neodothiora populina]|uniref:Uncharacterized protein n=1 Tax=Neodothiora populina TaxID=2781224 RepID=A0ABR3PE17_9PEZI